MAEFSASDFALLVARERARPDAAGATVVVPLIETLFDDQLTPVTAYRRLVAADERTAPSFLLESVEGGERQGRYSILSAQPGVEVTARAHEVTIIDHRLGTRRREVVADPLAVPRDLTRRVRLVAAGGSAELPFVGGWAGWAGYDTARYAEPDKLAWSRAPRDDRGLPDLYMALYDSAVVFDHVRKVAHVVALAPVGPRDDPGAVLDRAASALASRVGELRRPGPALAMGRLPRDDPRPTTPGSNLTPAQHAAMVARALDYIRAGDTFQVVVGQRFERRSPADPFDAYRALRVVNPSPYMVYMQGPGCILVASSPEILCRVRAGADGGPPVLTNRPLAGTRRRGADADEDRRLEAELLADPKERAEHAMLVDLGRNDVGRVTRPGSIRLPRVMEVERYSHVMHISSTVTGALRDGLDAWDALRATLPAGTISGAPKIRAMQVIDELEPVRRGPYGGGMGYAGLDGRMDLALALRTIVVPTAARDASGWMYHLQASGGIVADSAAEAERVETVNKAAALARAIDLAETAFDPGPAATGPAT